MNITRRLAVLMAAVAVVFGLAACGGGGAAAPEEVAVYTVDIKQPFVGREARDPEQLGPLVDEAVTLVKDRQGKMADDAEEAKLAKKVNADFKLANDNYTKGSYEEAQKLYESILKTYPLHYGANVNLTLALLQQEKNEEALVQALSCIEIAPSEEGIYLNVQAAGVACGFTTEDLENAMDSTLEALGRASNRDFGDRDEEFGPQYAYNKIWDRIETELYQAGEGQTDEAPADEGEGAPAAEGSSADTARTNNLAYGALLSDLTGLEEKAADDSDVAALKAYLYVVGLQLGCEADPNLIEPMHTIPFIAVDSDLCTIDLKQITPTDSGWTISFEVTNKLADESLSIGHGGLWLVNGAETNTHIDQVTIEPGLVGDVVLELSRTDDAAGGDATTVMGSLVVSSRTSNSILARYPISWSATSSE